jgi:uncharacterized membrane protein
MMTKKNKHQSSTLEIIAATAIIGTILALSVVVVVVQEANAATASTRFSFNQVQDSRCSGFAGCSNTGTITFGLGGGHNSHG